MHGKRKCSARGCKNRFVPYRSNQDCCSNACRQRKFYDQYVEENGITPLTARRHARKKAKMRKAKALRKKLKV